MQNLRAIRRGGFCIAAAEHSQRTAEKEPPSGGLPDGGFDIPALRR